MALTAASTVPVPGWAGVLVGVFWAAAVAGLALAVAWRRVDDPALRRRLQWAASLLFFVPHVPVMLAWNVAVPLVSLQRMLLASYLLVSAAVALVALRRQDAPRRSRVVTVVVAAGMAAGGLALGGPAARNLVSPPVPVAGAITQTSAGYRTYAPVLDIGGRPVRITRDLARHVREGMRIEGLALSGTRHLVQVRVVEP